MINTGYKISPHPDNGGWTNRHTNLHDQYNIQPGKNKGSGTTSPPNNINTIIMG